MGGSIITWGGVVSTQFENTGGAFATQLIAGGVFGGVVELDHQKAYKELKSTKHQQLLMIDR